MKDVTRYRFVGGNVKETIGGDHKVYSGGDYNETVQGACFINSQGGTEWSNEVEQPPVATIETTRVKSILLLNVLDEGSDNSGIAGGIRRGVVHDKSYHFEVLDFTDGEPLNEHSIKWEISSIDKETGDYYKNIMLNKQFTGKSLRITFASTLSCGHDLIVKAYIKNSEEEGKVELFMHNKFRWFDRELVKKEINIRTIEREPWKINQSATSLCGMACIFYLFAKEKPEDYKQFALELHRTGEATYHNYTVKPDENIYNRRPYLEGGVVNTGKNIKTDDIYVYQEYTNGGFLPMPLSDYVTMASIRNTDNKKYEGGNEQVAAINWPSFMTKLCREFLGYNDVGFVWYYTPKSMSFLDVFGIINKGLEMIDYVNFRAQIAILNRLLEEGYRLILLIDSDLIDDRTDMDGLDFHWVTLESSIEEVVSEDGVPMVTFSVYSWASIQKPEPSSNISWIHFKKNFYGYIKVK